MSTTKMAPISRLMVRSALALAIFVGATLVSPSIAHAMSVGMGPADAAASRPMTPQELTADVRPAVVRIEAGPRGGSGFVIDPDGLILTNDHVISDAHETTVFLDDGTILTGTVLGRDVTRDLALVKIDAKGLPTLELVDSNHVPLGSEVMAIGFPTPYHQLTVTRGIVSGFKTDTIRERNMVQTDATINIGNSGGPLLNLQGQVIGVVTEKYISSEIEGVGLAVSANTVSLWLEPLNEGEIIMPSPAPEIPMIDGWII